MQTLDFIKEKLAEYDKKFMDKYMNKVVLDAEKERVESYNNWLPFLVKVWLKINPNYKVNPHDLTVPLPDLLYYSVYVKSFKTSELKVIAETFQKYAKSNAEITMALLELHSYRGFSPYKRKLFYDVSQIMALHGLPLHEAMENVIGKLVDSKLIQSLKIGMESNRLEESLSNYLEDLDFDMRNNSKIKKVLAYPMIIAVLIVGICVAGKLMFLPQLFEPMGISMDNLPSEAKPMIAIANLVLNPISLVELIIVVKLLLSLYKNSLSVATILDVIILRIPVLGNYLVTKNVCFFFRNLYSYVDSGNTTIDAHIKACETIKLPTLRIIFESKSKSITEGETLSQAYKDITFLQEDIKMILSVAESNGALGEAIFTCTEMLKLSYQATTDNLVEKIPTFSTLASGVAILTIIMPLITVIYNIDQYIT